MMCLKATLLVVFKNAKQTVNLRANCSCCITMILNGYKHAGTSFIYLFWCKHLSSTLVDDLLHNAVLSTIVTIRYFIHLIIKSLYPLPTCPHFSTTQSLATICLYSVSINFDFFFIPHIVISCSIFFICLAYFT